MVKSVLVVDDEVGARESLRMILKTDYTVFLAKDAEEATLQIREHSPDVILLDIEIPTKGGLEFCRELKSKDHLKHIPVIFLTIRTEEMNKVVALDLGGDDFITKPFGHKELIARIKVCLRRLGEKKGML